MGEYNRTIDPERDLTVIQVVGKLIRDEIVQAIDEFYENDPTPNLIWDLTRASVDRLFLADIAQIITMSKPKAEARLGGRSAFVLSDGLAFSLSQTYASLAEGQSHPLPMGVFRRMDEALAWIESDGSAHPRP